MKMTNSDAVLSFTLLAVIISSMVAASYKNGFVMYSARSLNKPKPEFGVDRSKIPQYMGCIFALLIAFGIYGSLFASDMALVAQFSAVNTAFVGYALAYYILLKEKTEQ